VSAPVLDAIGVVVSDMATSLAFYRKLGCEFPAGAEAEGHVDCAIGGVRLLLDTEEVVRSFADWPLTVGTRTALAFRCADAAAVDAIYAGALGAGGTALKEPWDAPWGMRYAVLSDPDGTHIDLYAAL
jgi:catechol 2,3-dioxygenase-like lactoylglutathione lyase family enzyme